MQEFVIAVCLVVFALWSFAVGFRQEVSNFLNAKAELMRAKAKEIDATTLILEQYIQVNLKGDN